MLDVITIGSATVDVFGVISQKYKNEARSISFQYYM